MQSQLSADEAAKKPSLTQAWKGALFLATGLLLAGWLLHTPGGLLGKADAIGYAVCHRIEARSFMLDGRPMSLCARCTGMYLGALVGLAYLSLIGRRRTGTPSKGILAVLAVLPLAFAVDGANSAMLLFTGGSPLYMPNNTLRVISGTGMGLVIALALQAAFHQTVWRQVNLRPMLESYKELLGLLALGGLCIGLVLSGNGLILYPLALLSAGTVLLLLAMIYGMFWLMLVGAENRYERAAELLVPLTAGLMVALLQIAVIDLGRYLLTGSWGGFHITLG